MQNNNNTPVSICRHPANFIAFGCGSGLIPIAPGTMGTLTAIPIYFLLQPLSLPYYVGIVFILFLVSIWLCNITSKQLAMHDHPAIVLDEQIGYLITMIAVPADWLWISLGFILFRLFDIWKPWPINIIDKNIKGGLGIMLDDVLAAVYAWLVLQGLIMLIQSY